MASVPVVMNQFAGSPYESWQVLAWAGALVLTVFVLLVSLAARGILLRNGDFDRILEPGSHWLLDGLGQQGEDAVGGDEVVGDEARFAFVAAERVTDGADEVVRHRGRDDACGHGGRIGRHVSSVGVRESGPGGARADPVPTNDARLRPRSTTTARV